MNDMRIYVASLSDYNNGRLEGKWLDLSDYSDASELMEAIQEMLDELTEKYKSVDGEVREEFAVHDYEGIPSTLASEYMGEQDFQQLYDIAEVADDRGVPVEVLIERAGDTGSDDYQALADSLIMSVDGNDESDIVAEYEDQIGELGYDWWSNHVGITKTDQRLLYGEDVDNFKEEILAENPDMDESEAESQAEEMADVEEEARNSDLIGYLQERGYEDEFPNWVYKDYESAWKNDLSYEFDVIHHNGEMYVFSNNYSLGGTILSGMIGAYIGYKIGRSKPQKKGFETEKRIGRKIKGALTKKKMAKGGSTSKSDLDILIDEINEKSGGRFYIGGAYGNYELWGKDKDGGDHRIEVGNRKDIREALIKNRYNTKFTEYAKGGGVSYNKNWEVVGITSNGKMFKETITLGRMSDKEDVKNALNRRSDLNIREITSIKEVFAEGGSVGDDLYFAIVRNPSDKNYWKLGWSTSDTSYTDSEGKEYDKLYFAGSKNAKKYYLEDINYLRDLEEFTATSLRENGINFLLARELFNGFRYYIINLDDKSIFTEGSNIDSIKEEIRRLTNGKNFYGKKGVNFGEGGGVNGGKIIKEISTHKAVKKGDKIYIYIKGLSIQNEDDRVLEKQHPDWYKDELIMTISSENEDDLFDIFESFEENNRVNRAEFSFAKGGGIGFKGLSSKVAKRYEGESVAPKYQGEYGKRYSKSEAKEVGDKVAGKVYAQQQGRKMAKGGGVSEFWVEINESTLYERLPYDLDVVNEDEDLISGNIWIKFRKSPMEMPSYELKRAISEDFEYFGYGNQEPPKRVSLMDGSWGSFYIHVENLTLNEIMTLLLELPEQVQERLEERKIKGYKDLGLDTYGQSLDLRISQSSDDDDYEYAKGGGVGGKKYYMLFNISEFGNRPMYNYIANSKQEVIDILLESYENITKHKMYKDHEYSIKDMDESKYKSYINDDYAYVTDNVKEYEYNTEGYKGVSWQKGGKYAQGGGISGLDDLLRG